MHITRLLVAERSIVPKQMPVRESFLYKMYVELCQKHMEHHQPFFAHAQFTRVLNVFDLLEMYCFGACENLR